MWLDWKVRYCKFLTCYICLSLMTAWAERFAFTYLTLFEWRQQSTDEQVNVWSSFMGCVDPPARIWWSWGGSFIWDLRPVYGELSSIWIDNPITRHEQKHFVKFRWRSWLWLVKSPQRWPMEFPCKVSVYIWGYSLKYAVYSQYS